MYKIEIYDDSTLDGVLESFKNLNECGIEGFIEINGIKIYGARQNKHVAIDNLLQNVRHIVVKHAPAPVIFAIIATRAGGNFLFANEDFFHFVPVFKRAFCELVA